MFWNREHPIEAWSKRYISSCLHVGKQDAARIHEEISRWRERPGTFGEARLSDYGPFIVLPMAHALVNSWPGRDCMRSVFVVARPHGFSSLEPLKRLMIDSIDREYADIICRLAGPNEVATGRFYARWIGAETARDVLCECVGSSQSLTPQARRYVQEIVNSTELLLTTITDWRSREGASGFLEDELQAIVRDFRHVGF